MSTMESVCLLPITNLMPHSPVNTPIKVVRPNVAMAFYAGNHSKAFLSLAIIRKLVMLGYAGHKRMYRFDVFLYDAIQGCRPVKATIFDAASIMLGYSVEDFSNVEPKGAIINSLSMVKETIASSASPSTSRYFTPPRSVSALSQSRSMSSPISSSTPALTAEHVETVRRQLESSLELLSAYKPPRSEAE